MSASSAETLTHSPGWIATSDGARPSYKRVSWAKKGVKKVEPVCRADNALGQHCVTARTDVNPTRASTALPVIYGGCAADAFTACAHADGPSSRASNPSSTSPAASAKSASPSSSFPSKGSPSDPSSNSAAGGAREAAERRGRAAGRASAHSPVSQGCADSQKGQRRTRGVHLPGVGGVS